MEIAPDHVMLGALLSACKIHGNLEFGGTSCKNFNESWGCRFCHIRSAIKCLCFIRKMERSSSNQEKDEGGILKEPGCSSIEVNNEIHEFLLGDLRHPQKGKIYKKLEELNQVLKEAGHTPGTDVVLHDIEDWEKEQALTIHSERLAICYGLISTKSCTTIRVVKNLRVCDDCHSMIKLIAKITGRKIVVRDRKRFHHFENGKCSCGDY
ncbi:hypothetical protein F3Y22_tig00112285pilonHSYRG00159 [Hibiscus syriacus]|uniref:DYW domain-containing protein n=1 Tax=Hibiscus syriacus TaxID=106335 RepID=A0A6A2Y6T9_HIBSY|nr:hypothetical protein F3Y22_tig00112285pilonHSYRG00159 [Hibiscus syriacus]